MPIEVKDLISVAQSNKESDSEALRRTAVHSSYYAAYNFFLEYAQKNWSYNPKDDVYDFNDPTRKIHGSHEKLSQFIRKHGIDNSDPNIVTLGDHLRNYHGLRCSADYHLDFEMVVAKSKHHVNHCVRDLNKFKATVPAE